MTTQYNITRIQLRHDTAANWTTVNPTLLEGEVGLETDTGKSKIGDGSTAWNSLAYDLASTALQSHQSLANYVDLSSTQSITGLKTFNTIKTDKIYDTNNSTILQEYSGNITVGNNATTLTLRGTGTRPKYKVGSNTTNDIALYSDIPNMTDYYDKTETDTLLDGKQDELTAGDGIDIDLVYPDVLENTYEQYNTLTSTWEAIANPSNWSLGPNKMARIFTGQSLLYSRSWELTSKLPATNGVGIAFSKDSGNKQIGYSWLFRIKTISTNTITFGYGTNKNNQSLEMSGSDIVNDIITINNTGYIYLKVTHEADFQTCLLYYSTDGINWKQVIQNDQYIQGNYNSTAIDGSLYLGYTTSTGATVNVDLTKTSFQYTPARDPQLTISCDNTIARVANIPTVTSDLTNDSGYITGITSTNVTTALGYTPTDTNLSNLSSTGKTVLDGQWVAADTRIASDVSVNGSTKLTYTLSDVPNDGNKYEVLLMGHVYTSNTSGNAARLTVSSDIINDVTICGAITRTSQSNIAMGSVVIPVGNREIKVSRDTGWNGTINLYIRGYRRIGSNS